MPGPVKEAASGSIGGQRREEEEGREGDARAAQNQDGGQVHEVFGDSGTNMVMLALVVIAWISEYAVVRNCTC